MKPNLHEPEHDKHPYQRVQYSVASGKVESCLAGEKCQSQDDTKGNAEGNKDSVCIIHAATCSDEVRDARRERYRSDEKLENQAWLWQPKVYSEALTSQQSEIVRHLVRELVKTGQCAYRDDFDDNCSN
jgi:hypothetical protein